MKPSDFARLHPEPYYELFANADVVVSLPATSGIFGGTSCVFGGVTAQYKLPYRIYVAAKRLPAPGFRVESFRNYDPENARFSDPSEEDPFSAPDEGFSAALAETFPNAGASLRILSESPTREADAVSYLSVMAVSLLEGKILPEDVSRLAENGDADPAFGPILREAVRLRLDYNRETKGRSSMVAIFTGVRNGISPRIHMAEANVPLATREECLRTIGEGTFPRFRSALVSGLTDAQTDGPPFEAAVFHIEGIKNRYWTGAAGHWTQRAVRMGKRFAGAFGDDDGFLPVPTDPDATLERAALATDDYSFATLSHLLEASEGKSDHRELFFSIERNLDGIGTLLWKRNLAYASKASDVLDRFPAFVRTVFPKLAREDFAFYLSGSSIDLVLTLFLPKDTVCSSGKFESALRESFGDRAGVTLLFSSTCDGYGTEGLKISRPNDVFGSDVLERTYAVTNVITGEKSYGEKPSLVERFARKSVLADSESWKILLDGRKATSRELLSQQFTADLLSALARSPSVSARSLPASSYAGSVSDFSGKILTPLRKVFLETTGSEFPIDCVGSGPNFTVSVRNSHPFAGAYVLEKAFA